MNANDPQGYYALLGVRPTAPASEIKSAYRRFAKQFHPDNNSGRDATAQFHAITNAYDVIGNPENRAGYDHQRYAYRGLFNGETRLDPISCSKCGRVTAQPRSAILRHVVGAVVTTMRTPVQGIFCAACAKKAALRGSLISAFAGWWGLPWGPVYTVVEVIRNAFIGAHETEADAELLWHNAVAFFAQGNYTLAYALADKVRVVGDDDISLSAIRMMDNLRAMGQPKRLVALRDPWRPNASRVLAHMGLLCAVPLLIIVLGLTFQSEIAQLWAPHPAQPHPAQTALATTSAV